MEHPLIRYKRASGVPLQAIAAAVGVKPSAVSKWMRGRIPAERVMDVERATGIPRAELRPDLFGERSPDPRPAPVEAAAT